MELKYNEDMALKICSLSSSSSGNCIYVASGKTKILIDSGIPLSRVGKSLRVLSESCDDLSMLITHTHSDHISGIPQLCASYGAKVYAHHLSSEIKDTQQFIGAEIFEFGDSEFSIGDISVTPFKVSHDVPTVGFSLCHQNKKISVLTDLGKIDLNVISALKGSDFVFIESNHDEELLRNNRKYPFFLKRRIFSDTGHLSNGACAQGLTILAQSGIKQFMLGHLSKENNYPELAFKTVCNILNANGIREGIDINIEVAPADRMSGLYVIG